MEEEIGRREEGAKKKNEKRRKEREEKIKKWREEGREEKKTRRNEKRSKEGEEEGEKNSFFLVKYIFMAKFKKKLKFLWRDPIANLFFVLINWNLIF